MNVTYISAIITACITIMLIINEVYKKEEVDDDGIIDIGEDGKMKDGSEEKKEKIYGYLKAIPILFLGIFVFFLTIKVSIMLLPFVIIIALIRSFK